MTTTRRWEECQAIYFERSPYDLIARAVLDHVNSILAGSAAEAQIKELSGKILRLQKEKFPFE
jgi:hypothetical protein